MLFGDSLASFLEPIYNYFACDFKKLGYIIFYSIEFKNYKEVGGIGNKCIPIVKKWYNKEGIILLNHPAEFDLPLSSIWHCGSLLETFSLVDFVGKPHSAGFLIKLRWQFFPQSLLLVVLYFWHLNIGEYLWI